MISTIKRFSGYFVLLFLTVFVSGCLNSSGRNIREIRIGLHNNNVLQIQVDVLTDSAVDAYAEYWPQKGDSINKMQSNVSKNSGSHRLVLCNLMPKTNYLYHIIIKKNGVSHISKTYSFHTNELPMWLQDQFKAINKFPKFVPGEFKNGLMLTNKRYAPGIACLVDYQGQIRWYHMVDGMGFKVVHFTKDHTILSILGRNDEPTSYGSQILEVNLFGDTILNLKKGQGDFKYTIHHEIIKNDKNQLVTLYVDKRIMDLSSIGGGKKDTVAGDGILIMDNNAKKIWQWSVFDVLDPLKDAGLLKSKKDWMHANSLNFDKDGNYIISFYNKGQIWKVDAHTGKVIWKFGKGGTIAMPAECDFTQAHAAHINTYGDLMFFDNGVEKRQSGVFALKLDEQNKTSKLSFHIKLPKDIFNGRMGSAYMINDTTVLVCCSKRHIIVLANTKGTLLWTMESSMPSYRAEFIKTDELAPYLKP